jgi:protein-S-isoprenylcysteine O-methyltransferase Ste14
VTTRPEYIALALLWVLFCVIHSATISLPFIRYAKRKMGDRFRFYRLYYNIAAVVMFIPLLVYSATLSGPPVFVWGGALRVAQAALIILGMFLVIAGAKHYNLSRFVGIAQIKEGTSQAPMSENEEIISDGILGYVRHPWYVAVFLLIWADDLDVSSIVINSVLTAYLVIGAFLEERKLIAETGDKYREYQRNVSMFVPLKRLKKEMGG